MRVSQLVLLAALASSPAAAEPPKVKDSDIGPHAAAVGLVDIDVKDADVRNVLRLFADVGKVSLVLSDEVKGKISVRLRGVAWREAFATVLMQRSLGLERSGDVISVDTLDRIAARAEKRARIIEARQEIAPLKTVLIAVSYADASSLAPIVRSMLTPRGTVAIDKRSNTLIVTDVHADDVRQRLSL